MLRSFSSFLSAFSPKRNRAQCHINPFCAAFVADRFCFAAFAAVLFAVSFLRSRDLRLKEFAKAFCGSLAQGAYCRKAQVQKTF